VGRSRPAIRRSERVTATARKIAHLIQLDNEVIDDSSPAVMPVLTQHLLTLVALKLDQQLLVGSGTPPDIKGLANVTNIQTFPAAAAGQAPTLDNFADAFALLEALGIPTSDIAVVMHPRNVATLRKLKASTAGTYLWGEPQESATDRPMFGVPWLATSQLPTNEVVGASGAVCNSAFVFAKSHVIFARRSSPEIILDRSRLFNSDQSELRVTMRGDLIVPNPTAVVRITGFTA
jgi:HK97 family phage major capsid protein